MPRAARLPAKLFPAAGTCAARLAVELLVELAGVLASSRELDSSNGKPRRCLKCSIVQSCPSECHRRSGARCSTSTVRVFPLRRSLYQATQSSRSCCIPTGGTNASLRPRASTAPAMLAAFSARLPTLAPYRSPMLQATCLGFRTTITTALNKAMLRCGARRKPPQIEAAHRRTQPGGCPRSFRTTTGVRAMCGTSSQAPTRQTGTPGGLRAGVQCNDRRLPLGRLQRDST